MAQLWGGRFTKETDQQVYDFNASVSFDKRLFDEDFEGSKAHVMMLGKCGIISHDEMESIISGLDGIFADVKEGKLSPEDIDEDLISSSLDTADFPDVDLLIRTSGEQRISNYLLWQIAYAELEFVPESWPEFTPEVLARCLEEYQHRDRRFGGVTNE